MTLKIANRVRQTSTTTGTGTMNLIAPSTGDQSFVTGVGSANTAYYTIDDGIGNWEIGQGTVTSGSPDTLSRNTVYDSSNAGSLVNFPAGTKTIALTLPAQKTMWTDDAFTAGTVPVHDGAKFTAVATSGTGPVLRQASPSLTGAPTITQNQNAATLLVMTNTDSGTASYSGIEFSNGAAVGLLRLYGTGYSGTPNTLELVGTGAGGLVINSSGAYPIKFQGSGEYARLDSGGSLLVGTATNGGWGGGAKIEAKTSNSAALSAWQSSSNAGYMGLASRIDSTNCLFMQMYFGTTATGSIGPATGGTTVAFSTSSDANLKTIVQQRSANDNPSGSFFDRLKVYDGFWKDAPGYAVLDTFLIAQEVKLIKPSLVRDAVGTYGQPGYQPATLNYGGFMPEVIAELQHLRQRVAYLETNTGFQFKLAA